MEGKRESYYLSLRALRWLGLWEPHPSSAAYRLYMAWSFLVIVSFVEGQMAAFYASWGDLHNMTLNSCLMFTNFFTLAKMIFFVQRKESINVLINRLENNMHTFGDQTGIKYMEDARKKSTTLYKLYIVMGICTVTLWNILPLASGFSKMHFSALENNSRADIPLEWELPTVAWYPFSVLESPAYEIAFLLQATQLYYGSQINLQTDMLYTSLIIYLTHQLMFLNKSISNIQERQVKLPAINPSINGRTFSHQQTIFDAGIEKLNKCVQLHQELIKCVADLNYLVSPIIFSQLLTSIATISLTAFEVLYADAENAIVNIWKMGTYMSIMMTQLLLYCWFGDDIVRQSEDIAYSVYSNGWPDASRKFKREIQIIVARSQKPLYLTAANFAVVSREIYLRVLNVAFSYVTVLRQLES